MLLRIVLRELRRNWRFGLFFIFNLSLGLIGFVSLEAFKEAIQNNITVNAKNILSADIEVSARRPITEAEHAKIREIVGSAPEGSNYEFFAMLSFGKNSRLVSVKAIDKNYPLYGEIILGSKETITLANEKSILKSESAWIYPELKSQMNLNVGDEVRLGQLKLKISNTIDKDDTQTIRAGSFAPKIFINRELLPKSGLIQFGSTYSMSYLYRLPPNVNVNSIKNKIFDVLTDPAIQVDTPQSAGEDSGRQLAYLSDYLGLVAIVALFMSILGASYIYRLYLSQKLKEIAIFRTLGLQSSDAVLIYILQVLILGALASIPTGIITLAILPLLSWLLAKFTLFNLSVHLSFTVFGISLMMSVIGSFLVSFPFILKIYELKPAKLFSEDKFSTEMSMRSIWPFLPGIVVFWGLAIYQAHSWSVGSIFIGALAAVLVAMVGLAFLGLQLIVHFQFSKKWFVKYSLLGLRRRKTASFAIFIAIGLGALLMNILPQLKNTLQAEFSLDAASKLPSLFMFDIQDEQLLPLQSFLKSEHMEMGFVAPLVRARIIKVNGLDYERKLEGQNFKTREEERDARFRNRGINLSYRTQLSASETLLRGRPIGIYNSEIKKRAELSVEYKYAERVGLHIGDILVFDIQGIEVEGEVVNLRKVKWASFQPNFFILIQDGVLNDAPKTYIASLPNMPVDRKNEIQNKIAQLFSNVSVLDVARTVTDLLHVADQMSWSLELMAALALLTGYIVLYSIVRAQIRMRRWELNMLKILGASWLEVAGFILIESFALTFLSSAAGAALSIVVSFALAMYLFDAPFQFSLLWPLLSIFGVTLISLLVAIFASIDIVRERPLEILRNEK